MTHPAEAERGVYLPVQIYPMFETAIRAAAGRDPEEHLVRVSELWSRLQRRRRRQPGGVDPRRQDAPRRSARRRPSNRLIGLPVPQVHELQQRRRHGRGDHHLLGRGGRAPRRRPWTAGCSRTPAPTATSTPSSPTATRSPARRPSSSAASGRSSSPASASTTSPIVDLYSCFPSAVQLGAQSLGLSTDRQLTRTGGLPFAGGPWNNYVMHAIATVVNDLREQPGEKGLVWANGGYATKHAFGVYGTEPPAEPASATPTRRTRSTPSPAASWPPARTPRARRRSRRTPSCTAARAPPEQAIATCLLDDGRRAWGLSTDADVMAALLRGRVGRHRRDARRRRPRSRGDTSGR